MPTKIEGKSEYQRRFDGADPANPPLPDFYKRPSGDSSALPQGKAITAEPPLQHKKRPMDPDMPVAVPSYSSMEPPLQRKKKPVIPHGSKSTGPAPTPGKRPQQPDVWRSGEEYVLLGNQQKFTPNIIYKAKPIHGEPVEDVVPTPQAPRPDPPQPPPAPKVTVDTGAPQKTKKTVAVLATQPAAQQKPLKPTKEARPEKSPPKPAQSAGEPRGRAKDRSPPQAKNKQVAKETKVTNGDVSQPKPVENGQPEADSDYALKYKVGIAPPRPKGPKRLSEYQMQFAWKQGVGASPLLDAEQVVYKSSTQLVPQKAEFSKTSEYRKQFQSWDIPEQSPASKAAARKRSKSVDAATANRRRQTEPDGVSSSQDPRLVQESLNPSRLHFPHGRQKNEFSEYAANFAAPHQFSYEKGVWRGANPPQVQPAPARKPEDQPAEPIPPTKSWYQEVLELRSRAEEYKRRAHGTHFSRQHMAQLLGQQSAVWDTASTSSVLSALSLEQGSVRSRQVPEVRRPAAGKKTAWGDDRVPFDDDVTSVVSLAGSVVGDQDDTVSLSHRSSISQATLTEVDTLTSPEGRIATPNCPHGKRHHLDRTTPVMGGAMLSSPGNKKQKDRKKRARAASERSDAPSAAELPPAQPAQTKTDPQVCYTCGAVELNDQEGSPEEIFTAASDDISEDEGPMDLEFRDAASQTPQKKPATKPKTAPRKPEEAPKPSKCDMRKPAIPRLKRAKSADHAAPSPTYDSSQFQKVMDTLGRIQAQLLKEPVKTPKRSKSSRQAESDLVKNYRPRTSGGEKQAAGKADQSLAERLDRQLQIAEELRQTSKSVEALTKPTYGKPTADTHALLDEDASTDRPLVTTYVASPPQGAAYKKKAAAGQVKAPEAFEVKLSEIPPRPAHQEDDILSVSARSIASSCSLASEVLDRARQRRDNFWGPPAAHGQV